jgi:hypothetical protein
VVFSLAEGAAAVAEGEGFFVNDGTSFYTGKRVGGVGVKMASFAVECPCSTFANRPATPGRCMALCGRRD